MLGLLAAGRVQSHAGEMQTFNGCSLIVTEWADGDSFRVKFPDGNEHTVRLYGVDCIEARISDTTDARRLRSQRRYFGISNYSDGEIDSSSRAKEYGRKSAELVRRLLAKKFTVHTAFADAGGDGKYKRIYGYVDMANGEDLGGHLVELGLARAFGVKRERPGVITGEEYMEGLRDLELQAAKRSAGIWRYTDWDSLPGERKKERDEEAELKRDVNGGGAIALASINPNHAPRDQLMQLPGIGETMANRIIEGREDGLYRKPEDLARVRGIGLGTIKNLRKYLSFQK